MRLNASTARPTSSRGALPGVAPGLDAARPVAGGEVGEPCGELLDRAADAVGDVDERRERASHAAPSSTSSVSVKPRRRSRLSIDSTSWRVCAQLGRQLIHPDAAQVAAVRLDAARRAPAPVAAAQVVDVVAAGARQAEALGLAAVPERA